ncbi:alpha-hydroxy acid oxidase [Streptomyces sp. NPDC006195]|uniref:alpha-hydroxy acid oxidase n=1 Tax=unclassified Streptomyces TaxID=2593676 RepID=UPI0033A84B8C
MTGPGAAVRSLADIERAAREALAPDVWDFVAGGSGDELTLAGNRTALDQVALVPRALTGCAAADPGCTVLGEPWPIPAAVAPMAYQRLLHPEGEVAAARAAAATGVTYVISTMSSSPLEEITATGARTWFQLYWLKDRARTAELVRRAERAGCGALMLTVDVPVMGRRLRDARNGFALPGSVSAALLGDGPHSATAHTADDTGSAVARHTSAVFDPALSWQDVEWLRGLTSLPLALKGVLSPADARRSADAGVDLLVVSNHGGRQLDGAIGSADALPAVASAVAGRLPVLLDSGVRGGTDVLRALALGACGVLLGRPVLWGLATDGEAGVRAVLDQVRDELEHAMLLAGCPTPAHAPGLARGTEGTR